MKQKQPKIDSVGKCINWKIVWHNGGEGLGVGLLRFEKDR